MALTSSLLARHSLLDLQVKVLNGAWLWAWSDFKLVWYHVCFPADWQWFSSFYPSPDHFHPCISDPWTSYAPIHVYGTLRASPHRITLA